MGGGLIGEFCEPRTETPVGPEAALAHDATVDAPGILEVGNCCAFDAGKRDVGGGLHIITKKDPRACGHAISGLGDGEKDTGWTEIEVTIDSGACDTVMPTRLCSHISIAQTEESRRGMEYEVANGETIPNVGERHCLLMSEDSAHPKRIIFQCADIHKPLLSVSRCADLGYKCVLDDSGGELIDRVSGEVIPLHRRGNLYVMRAWIRQDESSDFPRPQ
jgi:hypothetical protein